MALVFFDLCDIEPDACERFFESVLGGFESCRNVKHVQSVL